MDILPQDIIPLIAIYLPLKDIQSLTQTNRYIHTIIDDIHFDDYYLSRTPLRNCYQNKIINKQFMQNHGVYLINISDPVIISNWFILYDYIHRIVNDITSDMKF